uniref:Small ribosomal subunit protein eS1 n=1 Tax=uncultured marine group II/III euryarchaeote KM3_64_C08 TaxID=1456479 RepID=A0A075HBA8_9EURY|nr:Ribosomal S3Ae family (RP-S3Ae, RPS3A) [uncultured marine group II/III euryarchaeote KM3_64_C08]
MATKGAAARAAARKQKDKWKSKRWYTIRAPRTPWNFQVIGETIGETPDHLIGRIYELTQHEADGDFSKMHVKLRFRVVEVVANDAITEFIGLEMMSDHVRRQVRRYRGKVDDVVDCVTVDGYYLRIKPMMVTSRRVKSSQKHEMRRLARDILLQFSARSTWVDVQKAMLSDEMEEMIKDATRVINPSRAVMVRKVQLIQSGVVPDDGMTLEEVIEDEARKAAEVKERRAAALVAAEEDEEDAQTLDVLAAAESLESVTREEGEEEAEEESAPPAESEPIAEAEPAEDDAPTAAQLKKLKKAELVELAEGKGVDSSGTKDDIIARLTAVEDLPSASELKRMKKAELVELAENSGVDSSGTKDDIIGRLT